MFDNLLIIARCDVWCVGLGRLVVERWKEGRGGGSLVGQTYLLRIYYVGRRAEGKNKSGVSRVLSVNIRNLITA